MTLLAAIDAGQLARVVWGSLGAGVGITTAYALVVLTSARWLQARREGHAAAAVGYLTMAVVMFCVFAGAVVLGVHIMLTKS